MIEFFSENEFDLPSSEALAEWITRVAKREGFEIGEVAYVFCNDDYLHRLNVDYLGHDSFTDIISFDYSLGKKIHGEIYISTERVKDNTKIYNTTFLDELHRVMIHGILHFCGYKDKTESEAQQMRKKEEETLQGRFFV
jgi:probable rRNA maturation factor